MRINYSKLISVHRKCDFCVITCQGFPLYVCIRIQREHVLAVAVDLKRFCILPRDITLLNLVSASH